MSHLPLEDKLEYTKVFLKIDHEQGNGDGALTLDEFEKMMIHCGHRLSRQVIGSLFVKADLDGNWKITLDEFLANLPRLVTVNPRAYIAAKLRRVFEFYDRDHDGFVKLEDLKKAFRDNGRTFDQDDLEEMFSRCDQNADGQLNFEEFLSIYVGKEDASDVAKYAMGEDNVTEEEKGKETEEDNDKEKEENGEEKHGNDKEESKEVKEENGEEKHGNDKEESKEVKEENGEEKHGNDKEESKEVKEEKGEQS